MSSRLAGAAVALLTAAALAACGAAAPSGPAATDLDPTGDVRAHDPALVAGARDEPWYVFSTGDVRVGAGSPQVRRSLDDGRTWEDAGTVWDAASRPRWVYDRIPGVQNFWAPEVVEHDGTWYLYYAASTFGSNRSLIGLMTSPTLDPDDPAYAWTDRGEVIASEPGRDHWNAIDPSVLTVDGTPWMAFGSFWGGIQLVELRWPEGTLADPAAAPVTIASRVGGENAIEAPTLVERDGWFYLFVSRDSCCKGSDSTYSTAVGRSRDVTGPYVDRSGREMTADGGEELLATRGDRVGPGGESYSRGYLAHHWYDAADGGEIRLGIRELAWDDEGWPVASTRAEQAEDGG